MVVLLGVQYPLMIFATSELVALLTSYPSCSSWRWHRQPWSRQSRCNPTPWSRPALPSHCKKLQSYNFFRCIHWTKNYTTTETHLNKGRRPLPKLMNFRKSSKRPLTPPPHFRKVMLQFFSEIFDQSIVYNGKNLQHKFFGLKMTPLPLWNFSENSSVLEGVGFP